MIHISFCFRYFNNFNLLGVLRKMDQRKKNGPVWFTLNPSVKIHRETQKIEFFKKYYKIRKTKTGNVLGRSLRLSKTIWWVLVHSLAQNNLEGILVQFWTKIIRRVLFSVLKLDQNWAKMPSKLFWARKWTKTHQNVFGKTQRPS